jgi:hypothetical protein
MESKPKENLKTNNLDLKSESLQSESLQTVMADLEAKVNPKSIQEGVQLLQTAIQTNNVNALIAPMEAGAKEFEKRVGRPMTYLEMRTMWG